MSPISLAILSVFIAIPPLVIGAIFYSRGKRINKDGKQNTAKLHAGWILLITSIIQMVLSIIGIIVFEGLFAIIFWLPLIIVVGLILTLALGINYLSDGYSEKNRSKKTIGWTLLIINAAVISTIGFLLLMFMTGLIPIRLM